MVPGRQAFYLPPGTDTALRLLYRLAYLAIPATRGRQRAHREAERGALAVQAGEGVR